ncbi:probable serine/threonine-protein kinase irlF [Carassius carassius]|uniref:probable serine/threonine-protein kinase irlF n=1 Tax=Carassius carassius TaxID=217509 RepID=UPI0028690171|nr:probable serine/threonine-protein kinase irlF [Carassius carassius]
MDALQDWALVYPSPARVLWVIVLILATVLVWSLFFCCWGSHSSSSPLERYLSAMEKQSKTKHQSQRKKKPKDKKSVSAALLNEGIAGVIKLATPLSQEKQKTKEKEKHEKKTEDVEEKKVGKDEKEEVKEEKPSTTVRKRNRRNLKVTIAPGTGTSASAEQERQHAFEKKR